MTVSAIILAAGHSSRFADGHKLLATLDGVPLIRRAILCLDQSIDVSDIVVVVPTDCDALQSAGGAGRWRYVVNAHAAGGLSTSLRCGIAALDADSCGALVALADMPFVRPHLINDLTAAFITHGCNKIVYPVDADGVQGHPVVWPRSMFAELDALSGDQGGKNILQLNARLCHGVRLTGDSAPGHDAQANRAMSDQAVFDIDTVEDLNRARQRDY